MSAGGTLIAASHGYPFALTATLVPVLLVVIVVTAIGTENQGSVCGAQPAAAAVTPAHGVATA